MAAAVLADLLGFIFIFLGVEHWTMNPGGTGIKAVDLDRIARHPWEFPRVDDEPVPGQDDVPRPATPAPRLVVPLQPDFILAGRYLAGLCPGVGIRLPFVPVIQPIDVGDKVGIRRQEAQLAASEQRARLR